ncbi:hypothetical protein N0V93_008239 [Gnomoniopsis smithogilvyi]|uniref:Uncharacterized protein n=1 Tax=Gnomoniopsis smithogilvyi TaxID=1191159 RepID=A0A9W8YPY1_9PEZI|nr:hypothetical protein N0V93_008239 [Gnomoniopsis smithogilvyi]
MDFLADIKEKEVGAVKAPSFPQPKANGFPEHKKRTRTSAFKQQRQGANGSSTDGQDVLNLQQFPKSSSTSTAQSGATSESQEKQIIEEEVNNMLASMSPEEIEEQRRDLLENMNPAILQMLLKRANIDDQSFASVFDGPSEAPSKAPTSQDAPAIQVADDTTSAAPSAKADKPRKTPTCSKQARNLPARPNPKTPSPPNTTHFPQPKALPDLDPSDPDFLETLHEKYFPSLPADPTKLAWMAPIPTPHSTADRESPYYPGQSTLSIAALRFDFKGRMLSPARSRAIPVSKGLHHHGEAPEAAGYTVAELGRLARSAVPAQRCVAFQTLGRILFRLGEGEWGDGGSEVAKGIWRCCQENRVMDSLLEAAGVPEGSGHRGSRAYATEAVWLFEKGGWREKFQGR